MEISLQNRSGESLDIPIMSAGGAFGCCMHPLLLRSSVVNKMSQKMAFLTCFVGNAVVYASGNGNAKSPPLVCSRVNEERGVAIRKANKGDMMGHVSITFNARENVPFFGFEI